MITQTLAILIDAYRELNARKLFWIVLILSGLVVLAFLAVGINPHGVTVFGMRVGRSFDTFDMDRAEIYKGLFYTLGVNIWLTWIAAALALISTAGIFPDLLSGGSIDLYLAKPIGRVRLFLTKYVAGLAFVVLQVSIFCAASFLVLGIRGGTWQPGVFWAVPIVVCFFSYVYCVCVLLGVLTRSTIAAVLLTILFWCIIWGVHVVENATLESNFKAEIVAARLDRQIANQQLQLTKLQTPGSSKDQDEKRASYQSKIDALRQKRQDATEGFDWHRPAFMTMTLLPKTTETVELMRRKLSSATEMDSADDQAEQRAAAEDEPRPLFFGMTTDDVAVTAMTDKALRARSVSWVVGTSLAFEAVIVALAAWIFCRRDY